jgi:hypothetical protein
MVDEQTRFVFDQINNGVIEFRPEPPGNLASAQTIVVADKILRDIISACITPTISGTVINSFLKPVQFSDLPCLPL